MLERCVHGKRHWCHSHMPVVILKLTQIAGLLLLLQLFYFLGGGGGLVPWWMIILSCRALCYWRWKLWGSERTIQVLICSGGSQPILAGSFVLLSPLDIHISFLTAGPADFRLQHPTQKVELDVGCVTNFHHCVMSNPCPNPLISYLLVVLLLWSNPDWYIRQVMILRQRDRL